MAKEKFVPKQIPVTEKKFLVLNLNAAEPMRRYFDERDEVAKYAAGLIDGGCRLEQIEVYLRDDFGCDDEFQLGDHYVQQNFKLKVIYSLEID